MKIKQTRNVAFWGMALAMMFSYGCPTPQEEAGRTLRPQLKATGGQTINVPNRPPQAPATVAIVKDDTVNVASMVAQALEGALGAGGIGNLVHTGQTVLIKPNMVYNTTGAVTDYRVVQALVNLIKAANGGATITIADGSATQDSISVMTANGYTAANFPGVVFANFNDTTTNPTNTYVLADSRTGASEQIPALITNADVYIDVPKMKTHYHAGFTGALKNLGIGTGPLPLWTLTGGSSKAGLHHDIRSEIVDHVACRVPDLTVMDAISGMEGQGPVSGTMVTMNLVLAGKDPVAVDAIASTIMGIPPYLITHMVLAANENLGVIDLDNITTVGNITLAAASALHTFTRATPGAVQGPTEPGVIPYRATTVIRPAPSAMTIDGDLSEWGYANAVKVNASTQVANKASWGGTADASMVARTLYDAQNLYLAVQVKDNVKLANPNTGAAIVNGDGIELYLSTFAEQYNTSRSASYGSSTDYHLAISYADAPQAYLLSHSRALTGAVLAKVDTSDGYVIEALIPWSNFGSPSMAPAALSGGYTEYRQLGLNLALDDADTSASTVDRKLLWNNATDSDIESNPIKLGMSYVDPAGGLYPTLYYTLTTSAKGGSVSRSPDQTSYQAGTMVTLSATPADGYSFTGWSGSITSTANPVTLTMDGKKTVTANFQAVPVLSAIVVSPATASVTVGGTQPFTAVAYDQTNTALSPQPTFTWSVSGGGAVDANGLFSAGTSAGGPFTLTAQSGAVSGSATVTVTLSNTAPTVATPAAASPSPVTGITTALSVLGADDAGEGNLSYTWTTTGTPPAPVSFSANGSNAAKNSVATFSKAGSYAFQVTIADQGALSTTSTVAVTVNQTVTSIAVAPTAATLTTSTTRSFSATASDQFGTALATQPTFTWGVSGGGTMSSSGLFTAGSSAGGPYVVTATSGTVSGTATVSVTAPPATTVYRIDCGSSSAVSPFAADQYASGGTVRSVSNTITTSGVSNAAPAAVYQTERYGNSTYTLPNLTAGAQYTVRLHFAELYQTASGKRKFNVAINGTTVLSSFDIYATVGAAYKALVRDFTTTANTSGQIVIVLTSVTDNATIEGIEIITTVANAAPSIATAAAASPSPVSGSSTTLSVLGADDGGEANLTYTWATTGTPPAAVSFSANGSNAAKSTTATFTAAGSYTLQATVKDAAGLTATSSVSVTVNQTLTSIVLSPASASINATTTQQFTATAHDQFGASLSTPPGLAWSVSGGGTMSSSGLFTAASSAGGPYTVSATSGTVSGTASVTVVVPNAAPTIATAAAASPTPVTGTSTTLSVLGADDGGEAKLTYTWATTGTPPAAVSFSANGSNAAKSTTATFTKAGSYAFQVTVKDQPGLSATSTVTVTVNQTSTSIALSPSSATVSPSATQQFTATARDQFSSNLTTQPSFTWSVSGGSISSTGLFTAGTSAGGPYTVTAKSGTVSGTASVTVASSVVYQIDSGASTGSSPFKADQYSSGGTVRSVTNTITTSGVSNAAPAAVYQTERYGASTYTIPGLTAGAQYTVRLHFAELYWTASGKRKLNVVINGTTVLSSFDIYASAGAAYKAVVRDFTATANSSGQLVIAFQTVTDNATIEGIEILR